ncbi:hypothetical protein Bbelb_050230 [Branchiostoma belcheri]|nr:hypothetical protein Bbelb_050230 [Branchiostoma belcheri]
MVPGKVRSAPSESHGEQNHSLAVAGSAPHKILGEVLLDNKWPRVLRLSYAVWTHEIARLGLLFMTDIDSAEGLKEAVILVVDDIRARVNKVPSAADIHVHSGDCDGSPEGALQAFRHLDVYVQTCDLLIAEVTNSFDQNFLKPVVAMENVLLSAANGHDFSDALDKVMTSDTYLGQVHHVCSYCLVNNNKAEYDHRASDCPKKKGVKDRPPRRQNARPSSTTSI